MESFLEASAVIDWEHPEVLERARRLADGEGGRNGLIRRCFE